MTLPTVAPDQSAWPMSKSSVWNRIDKGGRTLLLAGGETGGVTIGRAVAREDR